jgi:hypothetical protein
MAHDKGIRIHVKTLNIYLIIGLVLVLLLGVYVTQTHKAPAAEPKAPVKVSNLMVTVVSPPSCTDCFDSEAFAGAIKQLPNVNVTSAILEYNSTEGQALITEYGLARLPAAVITGETENVSLPNFKKKGNAYYFDDTPAPYYNVSQHRVIGRVAITYITSVACPKCFDITQFTEQLKGVGVAMSAQRTIEASDKEAQAIISKYSITKIPTMILSADALEYPVVSQVWSAVGTQESDGMLVMRNITAPYYDFADNKVHGLVTLTYLTDKSCADCYNVTMHKDVLIQSFGIGFKDDKFIDISTKEGKDIVKKYGIRFVPTVLMDKEASAYKTLDEAWKQVGEIASDGVYVFKNINLLGGITFKDLETNQTNSTPAAQ